MPDPFRSVTFRATLPQHPVADHEVFMSFNDDADAIWFREWWNLVGAEDFARWLKRTREQSGSRKTEGGN